MSNYYYAGLDVGGSTIKTLLVDEQGKQAGLLVEVPSLVKEGYKKTFKQLETALKMLTEAINAEVSSLKGIGLAIPAPSCEGVVWGQANLADDWVGTNICDAFSKRLGIPVYMTNDVNAAALGEYVVREPNHEGLLFVSPGTGFGGGFVLPDGKLYEGANGLALEAGHVSVPFFEEDGELPQCSCGLKGCLEAWVSLMALRRRLKNELIKDEWIDHPLNKEESSLEQKAFKLREYAEKDDPLAIAIFKKQGFIHGYAIADLVKLFDPGLVVIGGGLSETIFRDKYMEFVMEGFQYRAWPMNITSPIDRNRKTTHIEWAIGKDSAAALGMAYLAHELFL